MWKPTVTAIRRARSLRRLAGASAPPASTHREPQPTSQADEQHSPPFRERADRQETTPPGHEEASAGRRAVVVSTEEDFVAHLQDGDVLVFDKLSALNRLVQWGDNRPAGHVGVWHEGGVYEATIPPGSEGDREGGVFHTRFADLMALRTVDGRGAVPLVRTVSALRHRSMNDAARRAIDMYLRNCTLAGFGALDMVLLTPFALERSNAAGSGSSTELPQRVIQALAYYAKKRSITAVNREKVFCSQLVYRAYNQAGLAIQIQDSLYDRYQSRYHYPMFRTGGEDEMQTGVPEEAWLGRLLDEYQEVFEQDVMSEMTSRAEEPDTLEDAGSAPLVGSIQFRSEDQDDLPLSPTGAPRAPELADMVTPGDFWSSPSFDCVAVLHRPAGT
jgi:hypothetical protein